MITEQQRINSALESKELEEITKDIPAIKVMQILRAFFEVDPCTPKPNMWREEVNNSLKRHYNEHRQR